MIIVRFVSICTVHTCIQPSSLTQSIIIIIHYYNDIYFTLKRHASSVDFPTTPILCPPTNACPLSQERIERHPILPSSLTPIQPNLLPALHNTRLARITFHQAPPLDQAPPKQPIHLLQPPPFGLREAHRNQRHTHQINRHKHKIRPRSNLVHTYRPHERNNNTPNRAG